MQIEKIKEHINDVLKETDFKNLGERKVGKVRDVYISPEKITLISTDRHSSFDRIIAHIPFKGEVLNQISAFWFDKTKDAELSDNMRRINTILLDFNQDI